MQSLSRDGVLHNLFVDRNPPGADSFLMNDTQAEENRLSYSQATTTIGKTCAGIVGLEERDPPPGRYERSDR